MIYDIIIAIVLAGVPLFIVGLRYRWKTLVNRGPYAFAAAALVAIWVVVLYGSFVEPRFLTVRRVETRIGPGESRLRVVVVADTHFGGYRFDDWARRLVAAINAERPDVVIIDGDIAHNLRGLSALKEFAGISAPLGTYAVLGNWDYRAGAVDVRREIERYNVEVLTNEWVRLGDDGPVLVGLDDMTLGSPDWERALDGVPEGVPIILAAHDPDAVSRAEVNGVDLVISGHTHGGQIRLPYVGALARLPIEIGQKFDQGLFDYGQVRLFITSGAGESGPRARLFAPAEIGVVEVVY